jgi:tetratricopeptide (TPR) repeat protein
VDRALALDPRSGEALFARGLMLWSPGRRFPHEQAIRAYQQALAVDPSLDEAHHQLGVIYFHVGLFDRAQSEIQKALAINPGNTLARFRLGVIAMYRGDYERAYSVFNSTPLERNPALWGFQTATALFRLGRTREATRLLDRFLEEYPADEGGVGHSVRAMMLAKAGSRAAAEREIATAIRLGKGFGHFHHTAYNVGSAYALMGHHVQAVKWLRTAAEDGFPCYPLFASDKQLDSLRSDKDFVALMRGLERDWRERKATL